MTSSAPAGAGEGYFRGSAADCRLASTTLEEDNMKEAKRSALSGQSVWVRSLIAAGGSRGIPGHRPGAGDDQDRRARDAGRALRGARAGRNAWRGPGAQAAQRHGRRQEDRVHQGLVQCAAGRGGQRHSQAGGAGQGPDHDRTAVGFRGRGGQELLQEPAGGHLHQRQFGRPGDDAGRPVAQFLPLQHRRRPMDGGTRQTTPCPRATRRWR